MQAGVPAGRLIWRAVPVRRGIHYVTHHIHREQIAPARQILPLPRHLLERQQESYTDRIISVYKHSSKRCMVHAQKRNSSALLRKGKDQLGFTAQEETTARGSEGVPTAQSGMSS